MRTPYRFLLAVSAVALIAGCDSSSGSGTVRVMSQNLYLGADLFVVANETNLSLFPLRVAQFYGTVQASNVPERMARIADEIVRVRPDLVGLQEVSTYYVQTPADNLPGGAATPATVVDIDFLQLLLTALQARGETYVVASESPNADVELPATLDGRTFFDVRYRDADVILARSDVQTSNAQNQSFATLLVATVAGEEEKFVRGYQSVKATVGDLTVTFFNSHLETAAAAPIQEAQAAVLRARVAATSGPTILVGDLNSDAAGGSTTSYRLVTEVTTDAFASGGAPTCCQTVTIRNPDSQLRSRIDLILYKGFDSVGDKDTVFDTPGERTATGLWPSDHAGVWADLILD